MADGGDPIARLGCAQIQVKRISPSPSIMYLGISRLRPRSRVELKLAQQSLPNDPLAVCTSWAFIDRRQSRWDESTKNLERAVELDPQNPLVPQTNRSRAIVCLRRYADAEGVLDRAIAVSSYRGRHCELHVRLVELYWHADPHPLSSTIQAILAEDSTRSRKT